MYEDHTLGNALRYMITKKSVITKPSEVEPQLTHAVPTSSSAHIPFRILQNRR